MNPENPGETYWMFLSLLCLPIDKQLELIGGVPLNSTSHISMHGTNADHVLWVIEEYYIGWFDEVSKGGAAEEIQELIQTGAFGFPNYLMDFIDGAQWKKLRSLACMAISQAGLDVWPIDRAIDFNDFIELQD
ncbi:hypothetical protein [Chitinimonas taiwanensis]|uniref:hypothetical protein n=1 Tax=Chitinimonas taiwanensis TaxID=240412 RepID=UPI0035B366AE